MDTNPHKDLKSTTEILTNNSIEKMSFFSHLDELRDRLIKSLVAVVITSCVFYFFVDDVLYFLIKPLGQIVFTSPADAFIARLTLTLMGGAILAIPVIFYHIWQFIATGLKEHERKYLNLFIPTSSLLFLIGGAFAYFIIIPISLQFLLQFSSDYMVPMITIKSYLSFVGTLILAFGVVFELPLVLMFLTKIGIATPEFLRQKRKHSIVGILILSALITPPDIVTQIIMAGPLIVLYEIGIIASKFVYKERGGYRV